MSALSNFGNAATAQILSALENENTQVHEAACYVIELMKEKPKEAIPILIKYISPGENGAVDDYMARRALGSYGKEALPAIVEVLEKIEKGDIPSSPAANCFGYMPDSALPAVIELCKSENASVRLAVLQFLPGNYSRAIGEGSEKGPMDKAELLAIILNCTKDPEPEVRAAAADVLPLMRPYCDDAILREKLNEMLTDEADSVKESAAEALKELDKWKKAGGND